MQTFIKQYGIPTLVTLIVAAAICIAFLPLAGTDWADGFRLSAGAITQEDSNAVGGVSVFIGPLIKVIILMGIGVLITMLGRQLARLKR